MEDDQQFCLRWNNHQSTLIQNFDTLLESGTLVDCTLAAEGKYLKAHKVVLSACSPYFEGLLSEHYDKHPVFILKDVKFKELKAMMDYMYRGEVNISQDQLAALLKAAESLQIKGLSESKTGGSGSTSTKQELRQQKATSQSTQPSSDIPHASSGLTIEKNSKVPRLSMAQSSIGDLPEDSASPQLPKGLSSREGSQSPTPRKKKRLRRRSVGDDNSMENHEASSSSDIPQQMGVSALGVNPLSDEKSHTETTDTLGRSALMQQLTKPADDMLQMPMEKPEPNDNLIEPKSEYLEDPEESVEDLTLDDDMNDLEMEQDNNRAGPSHDPSQHPGLAAWHVTGDRSNAGGVVGAVAGAPGANDEVFLAAQEAAQAHRDSQESKRVPIIKLCRVKEKGIHPCTNSGCYKVFKFKGHLKRHLEYECGVQPRFSCAVCGYLCKFKQNFQKHMNIHQKRPKNRKRMRWSPPPVLQLHCSNQGCTKTFTDRESFEKHQANQCGTPPRYKCFYCDGLFHYRGNIERHIRTQHDGEEMRFVDLQEAEGSHDFKSIGVVKLCDNVEELHYCELGSCKESFQCQSNLIEHQKHHCIYRRRYKCPYCNKLTRNKCNIVRHMAIHKDEEIDMKPIDLHSGREAVIGKKKKKNILKEPKEEINDDNDDDDVDDDDQQDILPKYQCAYCDKQHKLKCIMVRHLRISHGDEDLRMIDLQDPEFRIINLSENEKAKFKCPNRGCKSIFEQKENMRQHRIFDCKLRPRFKCGHCDHCCNLRFNLVRHVESAHPNEPFLIIDLDAVELKLNPVVKRTEFPCLNPGCNKMYSREANLQKHLKHECGMPPTRFTCGYCGDAFKIKGYLVRHTRKKHPRKQLKYVDSLEAEF